MTFQKISEVESTELMELRLEEVERQCLSLCRAVIVDDDCNAAASEARQWFAVWERDQPSTPAVNAKAALTTWFSRGLRFSLSKAISSDRAAALPLSSDVSALLCASIRPVALECVYRNPEAGLEKLHGEYLRHTGLNANPTARPGVQSVDDTMPPEGISDEDLAREQQGGVLGEALFLAVPDDHPRFADHDLVKGPRLYYSILQRLEDLLTELERTGRLSGVKNRDELMRCRKIVRHLAEAAFVPERDQDGTTARVYRACLAALQEAAGSSTPELEPRLLENAAAAFTARLMELSNLTEPKTEPTAQTRRERVFAAVRRVDERTHSPSPVNPPETPSGA